jgi:hypothetical protein
VNTEVDTCRKFVVPRLAVDVHIGQADVAGELDRRIPALLHQIFGSVRPPTCTEEPQRGRLPRDQLSGR